MERVNHWNTGGPSGRAGIQARAESVRVNQADVLVGHKRGQTLQAREGKLPAGYFKNVLVAYQVRESRPVWLLARTGNEALHLASGANHQSLHDGGTTANVGARADVNYPQQATHSAPAISVSVLRLRRASMDDMIPTVISRSAGAVPK
jgi:hypothetical protein